MGVKSFITLGPGRIFREASLSSGSTQCLEETLSVERRDPERD